MLLLFVTSCEQNDELEIIQQEEQKRAYQVKKVKLDDIPYIKDYLNSKTNNIFYKDAQSKNEAIFDTENILEVIDTLQRANYSFSFFYPDTPEGTFYNLVVGKTPEGETKEPFVLKYICDEDQLDEFLAHNKQLSYFKGNIALHKYTDYFTNGYFNKGDVNCPPTFDEVGDPIPCYDITVDGSDSSGGWDNGDDNGGNYGDSSDYGDDNSDSTDSDETSGEGGNSSSDGSGTSSGNTSGGTSSTSDLSNCTKWINGELIIWGDCLKSYNPHALEKGTDDCPDCPNPTGGVGVNDNIYISSNEGFDDIEFDPVFWENYQTQKQNLPSLSAFYSSYPKSQTIGKMPASEVFELIGGDVYQLALANGYTNACAARVSRALVYSGVTIPNISGKTFQGADGNYYFLGARKLFEWMKKTFGNPDISLDKFETGNNGNKFLNLASGKSGIYMMIPSSPSAFKASGHADFFDGQKFNDSEGYFNPTGGLFSTNLWILN